MAVLKAVLHGSWAMWQSGSWVASGSVFGGLGEVLGVILAPKMAAKSRKYSKSMAPRGRRFQSVFLMVFVSKINSQGDPKVCI